MTGFIVGVVAATITILFLITRSKSKATRAFSLLDEADPWLLSEGILQNSIKFTIYDDPALVEQKGASAIVCFGKKSDGEWVSFVLEIVPGEGVVDAHYITPTGVATWHHTASLTAKQHGHSLSRVLRDMEMSHKLKHQNSNP